MGRLRNSIILTGHLGSDVSVHTFDNGTKRCEFTLATKEKWKSKDGASKEETQWHNMVAWGKTAELCQQFLVKGQQVNIEGCLKYKESEVGGKVVKFAEIVINEFIPYPKKV